MRGVRRLAVVLALGAAAVVASRWLSPGEPAHFTGRIAAPLWRGDGPAVLVDDAHWNHGTAVGRLQAFAELLTADGYRVLPGANGTRAETLVDARVSVVVNPLGVPGVLRTWASRAGLGGLAFVDDDALMGQEIETTAQWIENGGSLLLAVDPAPYARGSRGLAERLGVRLRERLVVDVGHAESASPSWLVFSRETDLLGAHPVLDGAADLPPVNRVVAFGAQAMTPPEGAVTLLRLSPSAAEVEREGDPPTSGQPVGGLAAAIAFERGRGRVVVLGDSHLLTVDAVSGAAPTGLGWSGSHNERFTRALLRWLARRDQR